MPKPSLAVLVPAGCRYRVRQPCVPTSFACVVDAAACRLVSGSLSFATFCYRDTHSQSAGTLHGCSNNRVQAHAVHTCMQTVQKKCAALVSNPSVTWVRSSV